ncbi:hypothetical protein NDU88_000721 [Pleurodeles waltl]|uniref:Uncharacterized protein n=1 Tax=Pleurodeles waltl TaxID=8319 RepID=A0AAV7R6V8_PLEWA|nr:hypothetical protein NDU88_000721 [Pleurodeles waltl]
MKTLSAMCVELQAMSRNSHHRGRAPGTNARDQCQGPMPGTNARDQCQGASWCLQTTGASCSAGGLTTGTAWSTATYDREHLLTPRIYSVMS